ncbi:hypothetical protein ES319_D01G259100v1 [Gossypium barbadense]|uniref:Abscisic acid receptor PYL4 n=1 Tax=Gossypium barbadense TaxID=3634 RepID=A0A5J5SYQ2_GOSBA|nr:hypothetical protein ES319_D01G259100v1 [Gossypium barbadense]
MVKGAGLHSKGSLVISIHFKYIFTLYKYPLNNKTCISPSPLCTAQNISQPLEKTSSSKATTPTHNTFHIVKCSFILQIHPPSTAETTINTPRHRQYYSVASSYPLYFHFSMLYQKRYPITYTMPVPDAVARHHIHPVGPNQCCSAVVQQIAAPVSTVWSVVRRFDNPQAYKHFVKSCHVIVGDGDVGTLREVHVISGLPAARSTERLEILDEESHVLSFSVIGGEHRLANYRSVTTLHPSTNGNGTVVVESYVVDVPPGNTEDDTCVFVDTIVRCNLQSLAQIAENLASRK